MPPRLLTLLTDTPQSGTMLGEALGVGRVSVHAQVQALQAAGYPVISGRRGYAWAPGAPSPAALGLGGQGLGGRYRYLGTVGSTQDELRAWASDPHDPAPAGAVVLAERQVQGRGRRGRVWNDGVWDNGAVGSALGQAPGLTFSVLLPLPGQRPPGTQASLSLPELAQLPLAVGVALHEAAGTPGVGLKWPNDLLTRDGRKLAGILLEADLRGEEVRRAVLGLGINVLAAPPGAAALAELRPDVTRAGLLRAILHSLERWLAAPPAEVQGAWRARSLMLGRPVRVSTPAGEVAGVAEALDEHGALIVQTPEGPRTISAGDVSLIGELRDS